MAKTPEESLKDLRWCVGQVDSLIVELEDLRRAKQLLTKLWTHISPYDGEIPKEILNELRDYFGWDDSE